VTEKKQISDVNRPIAVTCQEIFLAEHSHAPRIDLH
jgi:hypothetical protein